MSNQNQNPKKSNALVKQDVPVLKTIGWTRQEGGWAVVMLTTQGDQVLSREILGDAPVSRNHAEQTLMIEFNRRIRILGALEGKASA